MSLVDNLRDVAHWHLVRCPEPVKSYVTYLEGMFYTRRLIAAGYFVFGLASGYMLAHYPPP